LKYFPDKVALLFQKSRNAATAKKNEP